MDVPAAAALRHEQAVGQSRADRWPTCPVPAAREWLIDGVHALLVPRGSPAALANAILRLRDDPGERARLARNGQRLYETFFRPEVLGAAMQAILERVTPCANV